MPYDKGSTDTVTASINRPAEVGGVLGLFEASRKRGDIDPGVFLGHGGTFRQSSFVPAGFADRVYMPAMMGTTW